jgi:Nucleotidyltransferase of unknown function (DUF6036)
MEFDRDEIIKALTEVGEILHQRRKIGDVAIFGGSAMALQFDVAFVTHDIDAIISSDHGDVMDAVQEVGRRHGWNSTWLNEGVSVYLSPDAQDHLTTFATFPSPERVGLMVFLAKPEYLLALKLRALRIGSRDVDDVMVLARHLGLTTAEELSEVVRRNFPNEPLDGRKQLILSEIAERLAS